MQQNSVNLPGGGYKNSIPVRNAKYLVTGAAGFIGSTVTRQLIDEGNTIVSIDNLSTGIRANIPEECIFIEGDDFDPEILNRLEEYRFDAIIHIAGQSSGEISFENPVYDLQTNVQSTLQLLNYARRTNVKKFIYASSMAVYGDKELEFVNEMTEPEPKSFYAVGKLASENYMRIFSRMYGIQCTALRLFNVYGVGQNLRNLKQGMASIYLAMAIKDRHIVVKGSKDRFRDFVYITDVVDAVQKSLQRENGDLFEIYNVSSGKRWTVESIVNLIVQKLPYHVTYEYGTGTPGDQHGICGDSTKIRDSLGWKSQYTFEQGMELMIEWAQKQGTVI